MTDLIVRDLQRSDRDEWDSLYRGYANFYQVEQTSVMRDTVWSWLHDGRKEPRGLVAERANGTLVGLAHYRPFARPLSATTGCYLDDVFVSPDARGTGAADALINRVRAIAQQENWSVVRWITAETNYRGRAVYDRLATKTNWVTYDIKI
ncbi:GNAT family N-acetyltransferase [Pseudorhizobium pelagicum]|uniref:Acetyltransferase n=1 Tax=Pseudorhizobium pelagicum TaxID=1509405 RepID=A0A922NWW0_9HYPH|nr:GNAT family N-acetyltransferase [Pseudorhizobium pelagicum]KEQ02902.1 acetyltransferase [Pseudorhizobium pelagicum]KEQ03081.1 acetyltransferase [Pseudorhizobium pelagicum]